MILLMALLLPLSAIKMKADEEDAVMKIPVHNTGGKILSRTLIEIEAYYYGKMSCIHTSVSVELGEVEIFVTNCSTGETWYDTFDSGLYPQYALQISGTAGFYEVVYLTGSGNVYEGSFIIQ